MNDREAPRINAKCGYVRGDDEMFSEWGEAEWVGYNAEAWTGYPRGRDWQYVDDRRCHIEWSVRVWNCGVWLTRCMRCAVLGRNICFCSTERLCENDTRRVVEKCFQYWKGKTNLVQNPLADG